MKLRRFGRTGLDISEIIFGGGFVGGLLVLKDDDTRRRAIRTALDAGINWIDTAASYGQGRSEEALGWLLNEIDDTPYVSTKVNVDVTNLQDAAGQIERSLHESLTRLKRDSVDLFQLHNRIAPERGDAQSREVGIDDVLRDGGIADALDRMRDQGLTRFTGITALGQAPAICAVLDSQRFDTAQVYYNLLNPSAGRAMPAGWRGQNFAGVLEACTRNDVGVMGIRIFASGVLASDERHGREVVITADASLEEESARAHKALDALGTGLGSGAQIALRFGLANPELSGIVIGMAELEHLQQAIEAQAAGPLDAQTIARLEAVYESGFA